VSQNINLFLKSQIILKQFNLKVCRSVSKLSRNRCSNNTPRRIIPLIIKVYKKIIVLSQIKCHLLQGQNVDQGQNIDPYPLKIILKSVQH
jgi:hypothetical protein